MPEGSTAKIICYISPTVPDGMNSMMLDGFQHLRERWKALRFYQDRSKPGFYRRCKRADLVLIGTNQGTDWRMARDIAKTHNRWAIIDGSDYTDFSGIKTLSPGAAPLIFKREYCPEMHDSLGNVVPLSFSIMRQWYRASRTSKFLNFTFAGQEHYSRRPFMNIMRSLDDPHSIVSRGGMDAGQYWAMLGCSKIGVSLAGAGWDCVRTWEILSRNGCLLFLEAPRLKTIRMSDPPLQDGVHCVMFRRPRELAEKLLYYLRHESERRSIAKAGRAFAFKHHTTTARAKFVMRTSLTAIRNAERGLSTPLPHLINR